MRWEGWGRKRGVDYQAGSTIDHVREQASGRKDLHCRERDPHKGAQADCSGPTCKASIVIAGRVVGLYARVPSYRTGSEAGT